LSYVRLKESPPHPDFPNPKIILINTDREVESKIVKSYFKDKPQYKWVHRYNK